MSEEYSKALLNQSTARCCLALGYKEASSDCIETISDIARHYIELVSTKSAEQAELAGRSRVGIQDVLLVLGHFVSSCLT
jgi:histone H3/H4